MTTVSTKSGRIIKVVSREEEKSTLTESDNEMDERAVEAVKDVVTNFQSGHDSSCQLFRHGYGDNNK